MFDFLNTAVFFFLRKDNEIELFLAYVYHNLLWGFLMVPERDLCFVQNNVCAPHRFPEPPQGTPPPYF